MSYATNPNDGVRVHYEVEGNGPPILLHIGFFGRIHGWYRTGWVDGLREDYQLIMLDPRGQGESDKPHTPEAYDRRRFVEDAVAILDDLSVPQAHYFGYSMGARIGFGAGVFAPDRFTSLILGASFPSYERGGSFVAPTVQDEIRLLQSGVAAYIEQLEEFFGPLHPMQKKYYLEEDGQALAANMLADDIQLDISDRLGDLTLPAMVFCGTEDENLTKARRASEAMPNARFVEFEGLNHLQCFARSDLVLPHVRSFLAEIGAPA